MFTWSVKSELVECWGRDPDLTKDEASRIHTIKPENKDYRIIKSYKKMVLCAQILVTNLHSSFL